MIIKNFEIKSKIQENFSYYLLYGPNTGLIEKTINEQIKPKFSKNLFIYDELDIVSDPNRFNENIFNKSFFEHDKLIIINRATDKILDIVKNIIDNNIEDVKIIIKTNQLDKKSKLRAFFEKNRKTIITPFYEENHKSFYKFIAEFFYKKKIKIAPEVINLITEKVRGNRINLDNELQKIYFLSKDEKYVDFKKVSKLVNLAKDYDISELVDQCLSKNKHKTLKILNDNQTSNDDNVLIIKLFLIKLKRIKKIQNQNKLNKNYELTINSFKPPIFWKEKELIIQQLKLWPQKKIETLIKEINKIEFIIKKNSQISRQIINNFILDIMNSPNN